jgi:hypothetical protein
MGFHKRHVPEITVLKKEYEESDREDFVRKYTKPDALIGSAESMEFLQKVLDKHFNHDTSKKPENDSK